MIHIGRLDIRKGVVMVTREEDIHVTGAIRSRDLTGRTRAEGGRRMGIGDRIEIHPGP